MQDGIEKGGRDQTAQLSSQSTTDSIRAELEADHWPSRRETLETGNRRIHHESDVDTLPAQGES